MNNAKIYSLLIADDDSDEIEFLQESFQQNKQFKIAYIAKNGVELLDYITNNPDSIDVIISDMFMPAMTGLEAVERLRAYDLAGEILTIIFSNTVNVENQDKFVSTEKLKFYTKPSSIVEYDNLPSKLLKMLQG